MSNTVDKVLKIAEAEDGYLEKKSNKDLDSKTKNAGKNNWTKYGAWYGLNPAYWCAMFLCWVFNEAYGKEVAKKLLCGGFSAACETIRANFVKAKQYHTSDPKKGDVIFFKGTRHEGANHIGLIIDVKDGYIHTMEGNTSSDSGVVDNGGAVNGKKYKIGASSIMGFGRPKYDVETPATPAPSSSTTFKPYKVKTIGSLNIRSLPSTNGNILGTLKVDHVFTIREEKNGWGKVHVIADSNKKEVQGWISLKYTKRV